MKGFERLYNRYRKSLPLSKGEVKGRELSESQVSGVCDILRKVGAIFEISVIDLDEADQYQIDEHRKIQAGNLTSNLTDKHKKSLIEDVERTKRQLENMPIQLYIQSVLIGHLIYVTLKNSDLYFVQRLPRELGSYSWIIDAKDKARVTPWEEWWARVICPMLQSKSARKPGIKLEGANYSWQEKYYMEPTEYKLNAYKMKRDANFLSLSRVLREDFVFSADPDPGLEAVDILTNAVRRSLSGNFQKEGWSSIPSIMINRRSGSIGLVTLGKEGPVLPQRPYYHVLEDFMKGGRSLFTFDRELQLD